MVETLQKCPTSLIKKGLRNSWRGGRNHAGYGVKLLRIKTFHRAEGPTCAYNVGYTVGLDC
jgi:hypothetical protein